MISAARFESNIINNNLCSKTDKLLVAVSGGADSMALCNLLLETGYTIGIAHCNFKLRDQNSENDAAFVKAFAHTKNLPYYERSFDTLLHSKNEKISIEEAARNLRYRFFTEICATHQYHKIATAHHQNDNAETIILRLAKGTGLLGLRGIPLVNSNIIRPLLFASRAEIEIFCANNHIKYCTDESNTNTIYQRNKIRHEVIPILEQINPSFISTMSHNISHFNGAYAFYKMAIDKHLRKIVKIKNDSRYIPIAALGDNTTANILLYELLHPLQFNSTQITQIINSFGHSGSVFYSPNHRVLIDRKFIIICAKVNEKNSTQQIDVGTNKIEVGNFTLSFERSAFNAGMSYNENGLIAYFDENLIEFPLQVRKWKNGDYLYPLGLTKRKSNKPGKQKVSDILTNAKVDALSKEDTFVLLSGDKIIWVIGIRQDDRFKVTRNTKRLLKIKMLL